MFEAYAGELFSEPRRTTDVCRNADIDIAIRDAVKLVTEAGGSCITGWCYNPDLTVVQS
jgi:hypothetical protein